MSDGEAPAPALAPAAQTLPSLPPPLDASDDDGSGLAAGSDTISLMSSITRYRKEDGCSYHSYGSIEHWNSNDGDAQDLQDLTHRFWALALKGKVYSGSLISERELAFGWLKSQMSIQERSSKGSIQATWIPPNARFEILDHKSDWVEGEKYYLILAREPLGTVPDWMEIYRNVYRYWNASFVLKQLDSMADNHGDHYRSLKPGPKTNIKMEVGQWYVCSDDVSDL
jgi:hypothetical protein